MTPRQARTERRAAERKAKKIARKATQYLAPDAPPVPVPAHRTPLAFDALVTALLDEHQPANATEDLLVQQIAQSYWLTQRAIRFQNQCFSAEGVDEKRLSLFLRYQTTHERAFHKALNTLIKLKKDRSRGFVSQTKHNSEFVSRQCDSKSSGMNYFVPKPDPAHALHSVLGVVAR